MILMNGNRPVLEFDLEEYTLKIFERDLLPKQLECFWINSDAKQQIKNWFLLQNFISHRGPDCAEEKLRKDLDISGATLKSNHFIDFSLKYKSFSMEDDFWIKENNEQLSFEEIKQLKNVWIDTFKNV